MKTPLGLRAVLPLLLLPALALAQPANDADLYTRACAACHGDDGRGRSQREVGFETPLPDFTDCEYCHMPVAAEAPISSAPGQVQIYESIIVDDADRVTTALLRGVRYAKDNRLLPEGFDKASAPGDVAVRGAAAGDPDFEAGSDTVRYRVPVGSEVTAVTASARLLFQTIGYRWARNLADYDALETNRFVGYYEANAAESAVVLATAEAEALLIRTEDRQ